MRMTVEDLIDELKKMPKDAQVSFQTGVSKDGPYLNNHVQRVDNFGHRVVVVIEAGV
jgi:hypothetical protein